MQSNRPVKRDISIRARIIVGSSLALGAILLLGLVSVSYASSIALVLGFLFVWPVTRIMQVIRNHVRRWDRHKWISVIGITIGSLVVVGLILVLLCLQPALAPQDVGVREYAVIIETLDPKRSRFQVDETADVFSLYPPDERDAWTIDPPTREVTGTRRGLLLREVTLIPLQEAAIRKSAILRTHTCRKASVELRELPIGSFYAARDSEDLKKYPYIDTETVTWSVRSLERGVAFAYVRPPFQHLRSVLAPFVGVSSLGQWVFALLGFAGAMVLTPLAKPVVLDVAKKQLKSRREKAPDGDVSVIQILFLAANPVDTPPLRLAEERRAIDQALREAEFRDSFDIEQYWAVRADEIQELLLRHKPHIVHFSGHGSRAGEIILEDDYGDSQSVPADVLSDLFSVLKDDIRCVVLNACYSDRQAQAIAEHVDCVVGMSRAIGDESAVAFSTAFYRAIAYGKDLETAFKLGRMQIDLEDLGEEDTPKLLAPRGEPEEIVFVSGD